MTAALPTTPSHREPGTWPRERDAILDWLVRETRGERFLDAIFVEFARRLRATGVPIGRATIHLQILHPQWFGARMLWRPGMTEAEFLTYEKAIVEGEPFLASPMRVIYEGADEVRRRLDQPGVDPGFPICVELAQQGLTDYVAWPFDFTLDKRHVVAFVADRPGGFTDEELARIKDMLPILALVCEIRLKNRLARTVLETYVGPHASQEILNGSIGRGSGATVNAVILICDLRGFTSISELWPRDDVIVLLNEYFDAMSAPIEQHGGEILKFIGDGMLAIFRLNEPHACANAVAAATAARHNMAALNQDRGGRGLDPLGYGIAVHVGDVMYGNIGSRNRLDFTVIGPAVNVAARLEGLTKTVKRKVLFSRAFVEALGSEGGLDSVGDYPLRGIGEPVGVFALAEPEEAEPDGLSAA